MKKWLKMIALCTVLCLLTCVHAAAVDQVTVELADVSTASGRELIVKVSVNDAEGNAAEGIGAVNLTLNFDPSLLYFREITGGFSKAEIETGVGKVVIRDSVENSEGGSYTAELRFLAQKPGDANVRISSCIVRGVDGEVISSGVKDSSVTIADSGIDTSLYMLVVDPGVLSPAFDPECLVYQVELPYDSSYITVAARPNNYWAQSYVEGHSVLTVGKNNLVYVNVIGGDGLSHRVYTLVVPRGEVAEEENELVEIAAPAEQIVVPEVLLPEEEPAAAEPAEEEPVAAEEPAAQPEAEAEPTAPEAEVPAEAVPEEVPESNDPTTELTETRKALDHAIEQSNMLQHAAKIATVAAMAELLIIVILGYLLGRALRDNDDEDEEDEKEAANE